MISISVCLCTSFWTYNQGMRAAMLAGILILVILSSAWGAEGYKGRISTSISISDSFFKAVDPHGRSGLSASAFTIPPVTGMIYVSGNKMRMDMNAPTGTMTSLFDGSGASYVLDHEKKIAWKVAVPSGGAAELPLFNLDQMASDWDSSSEQLAKVKGLKTRALGSKKVNGLICRGLKVSGDISRLLQADEVQVVPGLPSLRNLRGQWEGTFWV